MRLSINENADHRIAIRLGNSPIRIVSFGRCRPDNRIVQRGEALKGLRERRGVDGSALSAAIGLDRTLLDAIEEGLVAPDINTLHRIAHALDCDVAALAFDFRVDTGSHSARYRRVPIFAGSKSGECLDILPLAPELLGAHAFGATTLIGFRFEDAAAIWGIEGCGYVIVRLDHGNRAHNGAWMARIDHKLAVVRLDGNSCPAHNESGSQAFSGQLIGSIVTMIFGNKSPVGNPLSSPRPGGAG